MRSGFLCAEHTAGRRHPCEAFPLALISGLRCPRGELAALTGAVGARLAHPSRFPGEEGPGRRSGARSALFTCLAAYFPLGQKVLGRTHTWCCSAGAGHACSRVRVCSERDGCHPPGHLATQGSRVTLKAVPGDGPLWGQSAAGPAPVPTAPSWARRVFYSLVWLRNPLLQGPWGCRHVPSLPRVWLCFREAESRTPWDRLWCAVRRSAPPVGYGALAARGLAPGGDSAPVGPTLLGGGWL